MRSGFSNKGTFWGLLLSLTVLAKLLANLISSDVLIDIIQSNGNRKIVVEMGDAIGRKGGFTGDGSDLTKLTIVFEGNTNKIITSFPN